MKIKKSEYRKVLDDKYWEGVEAGMKVAINDPELAKKYVDNISSLRFQVDRIAKPLITTLKAALGFK